MEMELENVCYCGNTVISPEGTFQCRECKRRYHPECLKDRVTSPLAGDVFYNFTCCRCAPDEEEVYSRAYMSWLEILMLTLYNLQLEGGGKCGYFHYREQICAFIDRHWTLLFGHHKKKKVSWQGTVAGTLSTNNPRYFVQGNVELRTSGWWKLANMKPPLFNVDPPAKAPRRSRQAQSEEILALKMSVDEDGSNSKRSKRARTTSLNAAIALKAKRSTMTEGPGRKRLSMVTMSKKLAQAAATTTSSHQDTDAETSHCSLASRGSSPNRLLPILADMPKREKNVSTIRAALVHQQEEMDISTSAELRPQERSLGSDSQWGRSEDAAAWEGGEDYVPSVVKSEVVDEESSIVKVEVAEEETSMVDLEVDEEESSAVKLEVAEEKSSDVKVEVAEEEGAEMQGFLADNLLLNPGDSDDDYADMYDNSMLPVTMETTFEPCHSPDMVDLVMSMPVTGKAETSTHCNSYPQDTAESLPLDLHTLSSELTNQSAYGKHPPKALQDTADGDSEGPSEENEESGSKSSEEEEEDEGEEEEKEDGKDAGRGGTMTLLSRARSRLRLASRRRRRREKEENMAREDQERIPPRKLRRMTPYDENWMLEKLNGIIDVQPQSRDGKPLEPWEAERLCQQRNALRRKLLLRKLQRENGQPVFDINAVMSRLAETHGVKLPQKEQEEEAKSTASSHPHSFRVLDKYMNKGNVEVRHQHFHTRLVGFEDHELPPITSPYTARVLCPFILRDRETVPQKVKLMQEIIRYPHRNDPDWVAPPQPSLDYSYVRPQHIPSVNALCREHFWPGIDLSECLQYPDFSCVAMYRKLVVGFAFLVPDVSFNEAYISFIFVHPEWRRAGIATFMIYHLCQTCMGKDITLHVSPTNPAMLLYQKFGFQNEQLCLNFYDKYFPVDSKECKHAFFMRLCK